jgi:ABC-type antimicrobial peptide transport system permease subunit
MTDLTLLVRAREPARLRAPLQRAAQSVRDNMPYVNVRTLADAVAPELRPWRLGASVFALFGLLALIVAAVGTYSVMQFSTSQRAHEMGVRIALGASRSAVMRQITRESFGIAVIAAATGVLTVLLAGSLVEDLLYETSPRDPVVLGVVVVVLLASAVIATLLPAWKAARVDPVVTLRAE